MELDNSALDTIMYRSFTEGEGGERVIIQIKYNGRMKLKG